MCLIQLSFWLPLIVHSYIPQTNLLLCCSNENVWALLIPAESEPFLSQPLQSHIGCILNQLLLALCSSFLDELIQIYVSTVSDRCNEFRLLGMGSGFVDFALVRVGRNNRGLAVITLVLRVINHILRLGTLFRHSNFDNIESILLKVVIIFCEVSAQQEILQIEVLIVRVLLRKRKPLHSVRSVAQVVVDEDFIDLLGIQSHLFRIQFKVLLIILRLTSSRLTQ